MRTYMIAGLIGALVGSVSSVPNRPGSVLPATLIELNGKRVLNSKLQLELLASPSQQTGGYRLKLGCEDLGGRDPTTGIWNTMAGGALVNRSDRRDGVLDAISCTQEDLDNFRAVVSLMMDGGQVDQRSGQIVLSSATGHASFEPVMIL